MERAAASSVTHVLAPATQHVQWPLWPTKKLMESEVRFAMPGIGFTGPGTLFGKAAQIGRFFFLPQKTRRAASGIWLPGGIRAVGVGCWWPGSLTHQMDSNCQVVWPLLAVSCSRITPDTPGYPPDTAPIWCGYPADTPLGVANCIPATGFLKEMLPPH